MRPPLALLLVVLWPLASLARPIFPLQISADGRHLTDATGEPFLIHGDAAWDLIFVLLDDELALYLEDRRAKGFNTVVVELIERFNFGGLNPNPAPMTREGLVPFSTPGDFSTPVEGYFEKCDRFLRRCAEHGMAVMMTPCYLGYPNTPEGWYSEVLANGPAKMRGFGRYVGQRFRHLKNIVWLANGDRNADDARDEMLEVIAGLREFDTHNLWTSHSLPETAVWQEWAGEPWLALHLSYTYLPVHWRCLADYAHTPVRPTFLFETHYEGGFGGRTGDDTRAQAWSAVLSSIGGQVFGTESVWRFNSFWVTDLQSVGSIAQMHLRRCLESRPWETLVPATDGPLLTDWGGDFAKRIAARAADGACVMLYLPDASNPPTVDMTQIAGPQARAWWFNPRTGAATLIGTYSTTGTRVFTPPAAGDWVLVLDEAARNFPAPGSAWWRQRTYAQWAAAIPGLTASQPLDNPDADPLANALEYTLGGDPRASDADLLPRVTRDPQGRLVCTLDLAPSAVDGTLIVESRASLTTGAWTELARKSGQAPWVPQPGVQIEDAGASRWRIIDPTLPSPQRFVRLRLEL